MQGWSGRRLLRVVLYAFFAVGTVVLAGSLSPERLVREAPQEAPVGQVVRAMTPELPQDRQEAWARAAERDPATLYRLTCIGR